MLIADTIQKSSEPILGAKVTPKLDELGNELLVTTQIDENSILASNSTSKPTINTPEGQAALAADIPTPTGVTDADVSKLLETEASSTHYKNPRYYALLGHKSGFNYHVKDAEGRTVIVEFVHGVFQTKDKYIVRALNADIARIGGIGQYVADVSEAHYAEIVNSAKQLGTMQLAGGGMTSSLHGDPHKMEAAVKQAAQQEALDAAAREIIELKKERDELIKAKKELDEATYLAGDDVETPKNSPDVKSALSAMLPKTNK